MLYEVITHRFFGGREKFAEAPHDGAAFGGGRRDCVITSYSIHYTKLYEHCDGIVEAADLGGNGHERWSSSMMRFAAATGSSLAVMGRPITR